MGWFANTLSGLFARRPRILCDRHTWMSGVSELHARTLDCSRESGAFLLGTVEAGGAKRIRNFVFYDDIDPMSLNSGIVHFHGARFSRLWEVCREKGYGVVADVHVHPGSYAQSASDQADPVIPRVGHIAFILPNFARGKMAPGSIGMYEHLGNCRWMDHSGKATRFFKLTEG